MGLYLYLAVNDHFPQVSPGEPRLARSPLTFFLQSFQKRTLRICGGCSRLDALLSPNHKYQRTGKDVTRISTRKIWLE